MRKSYTVLFAVLVLIVASSCRRDVDSLSVFEAESRLIGTWTMSKVENKVRYDGKWGRNDVSHNFRNWEFTFSPDYTMTLYIPDEDLNLVGYWEMYEDWESDSDGDGDWVNYLYMDVYDPDSIQVRRVMTWEDMSISPNNFRAREILFDSGKRVTYFYELGR
jgi:hypothetical protein